MVGRVDLVEGVVEEQLLARLDVAQGGEDDSPVLDGRSDVRRAPVVDPAGVVPTYATVDDPEQSVPRRRGRIYLGPIAGTLAGTDRPGATIIDAVLDLGEGIAQVGMANNTTWVMRSQLDNSYHKIESIWCDDAWDTQRRRGLKPLQRTVRDVQ